MYIENLIKTSQHNMVNSSYGYDHMVYVRLFEGCNLHCEHCFIPSNPKKIDKEYYQNQGLTQDLSNNANLKENDRLYIQWHGGEPTLLGYKYLEDAISEVQKDSRYQYMHGIQTNLMNFHKDTEQWVNLYKTRFDSQLGVSWDFAIRHTKSSTKTAEQTNQDFEEQFWKNIKLANEHELELYMVVTATKVFFEHFKNPFEFFDIMVENNIKKLNFERVTKTGYARDAWNKIGLTNAEYSKYMSKFFKAYCLFKENNPEISLNISPFDGLTQSVIGLELKNIAKNNLTEQQNKSADIWDIMSFKNQGYGCWSGECDTRFHTIDSNGYKHGCTALTSEQDNKSVKDKMVVQKIMWIGKKEDKGSAIINQRQERQLTCTGCEFISICSSGCLSVEKFDESQECSGAKTLFNTIKNKVLLSI